MQIKLASLVLFVFITSVFGEVISFKNKDLNDMVVNKMIFEKQQRTKDKTVLERRKKEFKRRIKEIKARHGRK